ncbi:ATP-binding cassette domain-containing protein [Clostridium perfringens]|nr:ATP-binding cassette domain-containing protein [Clostridium perfringens]
MIKIHKVSKSYGNLRVLDNLTYEFPKKGLVTLLGPSGCGKSTLLNILAGFDSKYTGDIEVCLTSITSMSKEELCDYRRNNIGFIFQNYNLIPGQTVMENILLACELNEESLEKKRSEALSFIKELGIEFKENEKIENLSGGQKQRVAIARALINQPNIILADEPTGALDRKTSNEIMTLLKEISKEKLVVVITHDKKICDFSDEIITLVDGKIDVERAFTREEKEISLRKEKIKKVSTWKMAFRNLKANLKRYIGVSMAIAIGITAFLFSLSSGNIAEKSIDNFKNKNTVFNNGYIKILNEKDPFESLGKDSRLENIYYQYKIDNVLLDYENKEVNLVEKVPCPKATKTMSYGTMPREGEEEIVITPSLSKKLENNIKDLIGKKINFNYGTFEKTLTISGIFNYEYDDFIISSDIERELYREIEKSEPFSISYDVKDFSDIVTVSKELKDNGIKSENASNEVEALENTFNSLRKLFLILSLVILFICIFISLILLSKLQNSRVREIGLLGALGFPKKKIRAIFLNENILLSSLAALINLILMFLMLGLAKLLKFPLSITLEQFIISILGTFLLGIIISFLTSNKIVNLEPAEALKE